MARICLQDVSLTYRIRVDGRTSFKDWVLAGFKNPGSRIEVQALRDISLEVREGERLGIIGHNGAGKSSLLRILAGIYRPSKGRSLVDGRISSLFDLFLGFEPDATGWENIYFRSYLQRETPRSLRDKVQGIAEFSGLGPALDRPLRYYSAGMQIRLAFAIATAIEPEILLLDEVLGAGDLSFHEKARRRMDELIRKAHLMILVSHDLDAIGGLCDRVLWLDQGQVRQCGRADQVLRNYTTFMTSIPRCAA